MKEDIARMIVFRVASLVISPSNAAKSAGGESRLGRQAEEACALVRALLGLVGGRELGLFGLVVPLYARSKSSRTCDLRPLDID